MKHFFERCSTNITGDDYYDYVNNTDVNMRCYEYMKAGLVPDFDKDIFVRPGYGALVFCCGDFSKLDKVINECKRFDNFYDFPGKIEEGYQFVIGPGVPKYNKFLNNISFSHYAVYCSNYEEIIEKLNNNSLRK